MIPGLMFKAGRAIVKGKKRSKKLKLHLHMLKLRHQRTKLEQLWA